MDSQIRLFSSAGTDVAILSVEMWSYVVSAIQHLTAVIRLVVRVPVLSEQMVVALPIVSQASKCRTRLLSLVIFCTANDRANATANGKPFFI